MHVAFNLAMAIVLAGVHNDLIIMYTTASGTLVKLAVVYRYFLQLTKQKLCYINNQVFTAVIHFSNFFMMRSTGLHIFTLHFCSE